MPQKKIPMRQCIGCQTSRPKKELVRVVRGPDGSISIDTVGKKPGRGAYLCCSSECLKKAKKNRGLERGLSTRIDPEIYEKLEQEIHSYEAKPGAEEYRLADTVYGGRRICAAARCGSVLGVQFHPEKSGPVGLEILRSFAQFTNG